MKYKVGDKVRIKSLDWYNKNKDEYGNVGIGDKKPKFTYIMSQYCGKILTIDDLSEYDGEYYILEDNCVHVWADEMIEGLVEEETNDCEKCGLTRNSIRCLFMDNCPHNKEKNIIEIPKDYVIKDENGNVINATKIVLEKKKKEYPKTYEECLSVLEIKGYDIVTYVPSWTAYEKALYQKVIKLRELIICRDAYWKIAGEEMGLGKPWGPDYTNTNKKKFSIWVDFGEIKLGGPFTTTQMVLSFPTAEMRDAFKENFDPDIEMCKELL